MALLRILIVVKTYPTLSEKYDELVCTAGFREDGSWIRIYPIPFRKLDYQNQYHKWQWIEMDVTKNASDFRPESYRPVDIDKPFVIGRRIGTKNNWAIRRSIVLNEVYTDMTELIRKAKDKKDGTSLAVLKPDKVHNFIWEPCEREWNSRKLSVVGANQFQQDLFEDAAIKRFFKVVSKLPYKFSYVFTTEDGIERTLMIEDWELGELYWKCLRAANGDESMACRKVKERYFDYMVNKCDLHFFMGTTRIFHKIAPNPFIIIGTFYPPKSDAIQMSLF